MIRGCSNRPENPKVHAVGRLAPSPTGDMHLGNLRTFLCAWLSIRANNGTLWMRVEDIDSSRVRALSLGSILDDLTWFGLDWDGEPLIQSERILEHQKALETLQSKELAYPCICTRADVERAASAPHAGHQGHHYPGACAKNTSASAKELTVPFAWRFRQDRESETFCDLVNGEVSEPGLGDFVIWKAGKGVQSVGPAYQLAVVLDDHFQGVTEVVRGNDLLGSTPKQIGIARALGFPSPSWVHVPLVIGEDGLRLAKRHGDNKVASFRKQKVPSDVLCGYLAWSLGWNEAKVPMTPKDLLQNWSWPSMTKTPWVLRKDILKEMGFDPARAG